MGTFNIARFLSPNCKFSRRNKSEFITCALCDGSKQHMTTAVSDKVMKFNLINLRLYAGL